MICTKEAGKCPYCGSDLIYCRTMYPDGETAYDSCTCITCDKECFKTSIIGNKSCRDIFNRVLPLGHIIDYHIQGNVFYGVVERVRGDTYQKQRYMEIVPFKVWEDIITFYPIPEAWNPNYYDAPKRLLDLLTPLYPDNIYHKYKRAWRDECRRVNNYVQEEE